MTRLLKKLEMLLVRKNEENQEDIFNVISKSINENFEVINEDIGNPEEMDYYFECTSKGKEFLITIGKRTYRHRMLLFASIHLEEEIEDKLFYDLKILLKNTLKPLAEKVYWIYDEQNEKQTQELYQLTSKAENRFRVLIVHFMTYKYGLDWWDKVAEKIKGDKEKRLEGYQRALTDLKDISLDMYSLDISDLTKLVESEYTFNVKFSVDIKNQHELPSDQDLIRKTLRKKLKELVDNPFDFELTNEKGFWKNQLSVFFRQPEEFKQKWDRLTCDRNHIAHNKIIDLNMYNIMKKTCGYVIEELDAAIDKINHTEISQEELNYRETLEQLIIKETKRNDIKDLGARLYSEEQIEELFTNYLKENILSSADDMLYFCEALQSYYVDLDINDINLPQALIEATGYNDEYFAFSIVNCIINDGEGEESQLTLRLVREAYSNDFTITFINPTVELNEDNIYEVVTADEFNTYDLEKDVDRELGGENIVLYQLERFINEQPSNRALEKMMED